MGKYHHHPHSTLGTHIPVLGIFFPHLRSQSVEVAATHTSLAALALTAHQNSYSILQFIHLATQKQATLHQLVQYKRYKRTRV